MNTPPALRRGMTRLAWPLGVLAVGLLLTLAGWRTYQQDRQRGLAAEFTTHSLAATRLIQVRLGDYEQALLGVRGLFAATAQVSPETFAAYVANLKVEESYPGIQGIGFSALIPASEKARHEREVRRQGFSEYRMHPERNQASYSSIIYLEPFRNRNLRAFGYDMLTEPVRAQAMLRARDEGQTSLSGRVRLVQETETDVQPGVLMYVPVYARGSATLTLEDRRRNLIGWVYAPFRMNDLMNGLLGTGAVGLAITVYDGADGGAANLLFDRASNQAHSSLRHQQVLSFGGHAWTVVIRPVPTPLIILSRNLGWAILNFGGLVSLLLAGAAHFLGEQFSRLRAMNASLERSVVELDQAREGAVEAEFKYRTLSNSGEALIWTSGPDKLCDYFNEPWMKFTGRTLEQELGHGWVEGVHPEDLQRCMAISTMAFDRREPFSRDYRLRTASGEYRWIVDKGSPRFDFAGQFLGYIGHCLDITPRMENEQAIKNSEERNRVLAESAPDAIVTCNSAGQIVGWNRSAESVFGYTTEEALAQPLQLVIPERFQGTHLEGMTRLRLGGVPSLLGRVVEVTGRRKDGTEVPLELSMSRWETAAGWFITGILRDISERKRALGHLQDSEEKFRALVETAQELIWKCDSAGRFIYLNPAWEKTHGYRVEEMLGKRFGDFQSPEVFAQDALVFAEVMAGGSLRNHETTHLTKDGQVITLLFNAIPDLDREGRVMGVQGTATDITHRRREEEQERRLQAQLHQFEKLEGLGLLAGGVAHDMNNVLAAILGMASANQESQPPGSPIHHALEVISQAALRGRTMVATLLNFARKTPAEERQLDVNGMLREEVRLLIHSALSQVNLELDLAPDLRPMRGDAHALANAFMNLCINAADAMPENGKIILRTRNVDAHWIEVQVLDTGCGMPKDVLAKALDPFFTTKEVGKGTGLGLSLVHSSVKAHRGQLDIQSDPGKGTCVRLRFPACDLAPPCPEAPKEPKAALPWASGRSLAVLVVDDDAMTRVAIQTILLALNHADTAVACGEEALVLLQEGFRPDAVILDMNMPGLGGSGTLPRLRVLHPEVPVLLVTGRADQTALDLAAAHPGVTLLSKPFSKAELKQHLDRVAAG